MNKKIIRFDLSVNKIDTAIKELKDYRKLVKAKMETLRQRVADMLADEVRRGFSGAVVDDLISGGKRLAMCRFQFLTGPTQRWLLPAAQTRYGWNLAPEYITTAPEEALRILKARNWALLSGDMEKGKGIKRFGAFMKMGNYI